MTNYRALYNGQKITIVSEDDITTVTYPANGLKAIQGTPEDIVEALSGKGIDFSKLWKDGIIPRVSPESEIYISNHPSDAEISRQISVHSMPINQDQKFFWLNLIIRHFDTGGDHITEPYDDAMFCIKTDNSEEIDGVGGYDYFRNLVENGANLFELQLAQIPIMDSLGRFGVEIYS